MRKILAIGAVAILLIGCAKPAEKKVEMGSFRLRALTGEEVDLKKYAGRTVFINVWATWCRPCVQEMPTIAAAMEKLRDRDIVFLFASPEEVEDIATFRDNRTFPFTYVQLENLEELGIEAVPATFIFAPSGDLVFGEAGFRDWSEAENLKRITLEP